MSARLSQPASADRWAARFDALPLGALCIGLACLAAFSSSLSGGYVFDDHALVEQSAVLRGPLWRIWFTTDAADAWPLTYTSFWLELRLWGATPAAHHAVNVALHALVATLLWRTLRRLELPGAWLAGLLFAIHPVTVESVAWISERKNVLSGVFYLAALLSWLRFRASGRAREYVTSLGLFVLALLSKTSTVVLPLVLVGIELWRRQPLTRKTARLVAPFFLLSLAFGLLTWWSQTTVAMAGGVTGPGWPERFGRSAWAWLSYLRHAFLPTGLSFLYPPFPAASAPVFWLPLAITVVLLAALGWKGREGHLRPLTFALGYHLLAVAPVVGLLEIAYFGSGPVSNHLQYLALMGPVALLAAGLAHAATRWWGAAVTLSTTAVVALGVSTATRAAAFRDDLTLWTAAAKDAPQSFNAAWTLALRLGEAGRPRDAWGTMVELQARLVDPVARLRASAVLELLRGAPEQAVALATQAQALRDDFVFQLDLGGLLLSEGYPAAAARLLQPELARHPGNLDLRYRLGSALTKAGRLDEALEVVREACRLSRRPSDSCTAFVMLLSRGREPRVVRDELASALGAPPEDPVVEAILQDSRPGPPR